jgi:uncharacterized surface protein with fasciclin (FAS1) repeats
MSKTSLIAIAGALTLALAGCATGGANTTAPAATVAEAAARQPELHTLNKLLADAGMADTLKGAGPYTVFAPSDEAFKAVPAKTMSELVNNKELLRQVLAYHVVPARLGAAEVSNRNVKSMQGAELALSKAGGIVTVEDAMVVQADVPAANGVVHVIDRVLMPPKK